MTYTMERVISREGTGFACRYAYLSVGRDGDVYLVSTEIAERGPTMYLLRTNLDGTTRKGFQHLLFTDVILGSKDGSEGFTYATGNAGGYVALGNYGTPTEVWMYGPDLAPDPIARVTGEFAGGGGGYRVEAGAVSGRFYALAQYGVGDGVDTPVTPHAQIEVIGAPPTEQLTGLTAVPLPFGHDATTLVLDFRVRETGTADAPAPVFYVLYKVVLDPTHHINHLAKVDSGGTVLWDRVDDPSTGGVLNSIMRQTIGENTAAPGHGGVSGGFDIADTGHVYLLAPTGAAVYRIPDDGTTPATALPLPSGAPSAADAPYKELRIVGGQALLQRFQDRELYGVFALPDPASSGSIAFERSVLCRHDVVSAGFGAEQDIGAAWTAGESVTATLTVNRFGPGVDVALPAPSWKAWVRSVGAQDHRELAVSQTDATTFQIAVPADLSGLMQLTLAPHTGPWRTGLVDEFRLRRVIEVRPPGVTGSVSISTETYYHGAFTGLPPSPDPRPFNRLRYAVGEPIIVNVSVRPAPSAARDLVLRLDDVSGASPVTVAQSTLTVPTTGSVTVTVPASVSALLRTGSYLLTTTAADLTVAAQPIELGSGRPPSGFRRVWFGDLQGTYPANAGVFVGPAGADYLDAADTAAAHLERARRLGWTLVVDRLPDQQGGLALLDPTDPSYDRDPSGTAVATTANRLVTDSHAVDPAKIWALPAMLDIICGYGAQGVGVRSVLLTNDTSLPLPEYNATMLGTQDPLSTRFQNLAWTNRILSGYPAFEGWHWAANWWNQELGPTGLPAPGKYPSSLDSAIPAYNTALLQTRADGQWRQILAIWFAHAVQHVPSAARTLRKELLAAADAGYGRADLVAAHSGPPTQAFFYPPESFAEADEVDLQSQQEQYPLMLGSAFWTDFCRRPGKALVLHEESYNDSGTGDQVLGQAFEALLRGAGSSGHAAAGNASLYTQMIPWARQYDQLPDPRYLGTGLPGMFRVLSEVLHEYGEWVCAFGSADPVAILLSRRQFAVQRWHSSLPGHTGRVFEAYLSLLYAHIPASLVFVEDLGTPGVRPITDYAAVLLVNERVELDPKVRAALAAAQQAGVKVFHDGTSPGDTGFPEDGDGCLDTVVAGLGSTSLGLSFGKSYTLWPGTVDNAFAQLTDDSAIFNLDNVLVDQPISWTGIAMANVSALRSALAGVIGTTHATASDPQVLTSERTAGAARLVLAVNNSIFSTDASTFGVDNAIFRRADTLHSVRAPLPARVTLPALAAGAVVYDVFGGTQLLPDADGTVPIDLRHWPAAILAVLPSPITGVSVSAGPVLSSGGSGPAQIDWAVSVVGGSGAGGTVPLPVRVRVLDASLDVLWERTVQAPTNGVFTVPVNARGKITVEAVELITGQAGTADGGITVGSGGAPMDLLTGPGGGGASAAAATSSLLGTTITSAAIATTVAPAPLFTSGDSAATDTAAIATTAAPAPHSTPGADWQPAAQRLGAHLSGIALTADGASAVLSAANWDGNLFAIDLATGAQRWQTRVGHQFSYLPRTLPQGVAVVGADLTAPAEFGLHLVDPGSGAVRRRFDLYGTTPRWFDRTSTGLTDGRPPAFAAAPDGSWIASAGNLGLAVWNADGTPRWSQAWWLRDPHTAHPGRAATALLAALDAKTLLVVDNLLASAYNVAPGSTAPAAPLYQLDLSTTLTTGNGKATGVAVSPDGTGFAVAVSNDDGRVLILDTATLELRAVLTTRADELAWLPDGSGLITVYDTRVCRYRHDPATGWALDRCYPARDVAHHLDVAADGRVAFGDEQGNLTVLDPTLTPVFTADLGGLPVPRWLPDGDLLVGTWLGRLERLTGPGYQAAWSTTVRSNAPDMRREFLAAPTAPVTAVTDPGNAVAPLTGPNLYPANTAVALDPSIPGMGSVPTPAAPNPVPAGYQPAPMPRPYLRDSVVEDTAASASNTPPYGLLFTFPAPVTFNAISLWDDPAHPEAWLRDTRLDIRTSPAEPWQPVTRLVSDQPSRSHLVTDPARPGQPVTATQLRLVLPPGIAGNIRLAAVALHLTS
ncbi:hypothetical protein ABH935_005751 [Catenulispora sp. GAS73]|uniref:hypothetical protein n=1 Tax=Catenulispora sp. GAS73 TaxID=3156269 RepID=UPI003513FD4D